MYETIFYAHVLISLIALILGITSVVIALKGIFADIDYKPKYRLLGKAYVVSLYIQLAMGMLMYFYPSGLKSWMETGSIKPGNSTNLKFWEIEHVSIMIFALFIVQIGCIFIGNTNNSKRKYRLSLFYFGVPLVLMIFSMIMSMR